MPYNRPNLPYTSGDLPNNTRFTDITNSSPDNAVSAQIFDTDVNAAFDSINALEIIVNGIGAGILPGANNPLNANKLPTTDGHVDPTISFIFINDTNIQPGGISGISLAANSIPTNCLQNGCITNQKILDQNVTQSKLGLLSVGTPQLQLLSVNDSIIANMNGSKIIAGSLTALQMANQTITATQISPSFASTKATQEAAASSLVYTNPATQQYHPSANAFSCQFNGTLLGTNPPTSGYNVTSITRGATPGLYTINFTVPFQSANYRVHISCGTSASLLYTGVVDTTKMTASSCGIITFNVANLSQTDVTMVFVTGSGVQ